MGEFEAAGMRQDTSPLAMNRRHFLKRASQAAGALLLLPSWLSGCGSSQPEWVLTQGDEGLSLASLQARLEGPVVSPGQPEFAQLVQPWNLRYQDKVPAAVARCASLEDIRQSLDWAQDRGVPFAVRSGGHSYSAFSSVPNGLMIDISQLRSVELDPGSGQVRLGPGARNQTVYDSLRGPSLAVTHGRCYQVGVSGLCLGGGIGFNMRLHGLTCDQLVETTVLLADGREIVANATEHSDLFWACRGGGGGNFGIHTSFTFQTFAVTEVTAFRVSWTSAIEELFAEAMAILTTAPRELGVKLSLVAGRDAGGSPTLALQLLGQLRGSETALRDLFAPLYALAAPESEFLQTLPYWDAQDRLSEEGEPQWSLERSRYLFAPLSEQGQATVLERLRAWPGLANGQADWKVFLTGGAVADVAPEATAYVHRQAFGVSSVEVEWNQPNPPESVQQNLDWANAFHEAMQPYTSQQSYQNFIDASQNDYLRAYYGDNLERLVEVKRAYDPEDVFHYPQSIPTRLPGA